MASSTIGIFLLFFERLRRGEIVGEMKVAAAGWPTMWYLSFAAASYNAGRCFGVSLVKVTKAA